LQLRSFVALQLSNAFDFCSTAQRLNGPPFSISNLFSDDEIDYQLTPARPAGYSSGNN